MTTTVKATIRRLATLSLLAALLAPVAPLPIEAPAFYPATYAGVR